MNSRPSTLYISLFLVTLATMTYELLLTRIFSALYLYHFAFMAVSIAMFGMTAGAIAVYVMPRNFPPEKTGQQLVNSSFLFSVTTVLSFVLQLLFPPILQFSSEWMMMFVY